jgi:benzil reductase ((S)-benzoin forming)
MKHLTILTGGSRGMGLSLARQLLHADSHLLTLARQPAVALQEEAKQAGAQLAQWALDLTDPAPAATQLLRWLQTQNGTNFASATLINNAGVVTDIGPLEIASFTGLSQAVRVGLEAALLLSAAFLQGTAQWICPRKVLNISSGLGRRAMAGSASYCAAKAGMDHFTRAVALEQAALPHGARVASLAPGVIDTDMQLQLRSADATRFPERATFEGLHANGQLMSADAAAAKVLAYLARADFGHNPVGDVRDV